MTLNERCFKKIVQLGPGQSVQDHIIELQARNNSRYAFTAMLSNSNNLMEGQFEQLELNGHAVQVVPYPTVSEVS